MQFGINFMSDAINIPPASRMAWVSACNVKHRFSNLIGFNFDNRENVAHLFCIFFLRSPLFGGNGLRGTLQLEKLCNALVAMNFDISNFSFFAVLEVHEPQEISPHRLVPQDG